MDPKEELWLEGLKQGLTMCFRPLGSSMAPFLRNGDIVTIKPGSWRIGDIVLTKCDGGMVLHRLVIKYGDRIVTKGDALSHFDESITTQDVLGKACTRERKGRVSVLDSLPARFLGMAFCLSFYFLPGALSVFSMLKWFVRRRVRRTVQITKLYEDEL